MLLFNERIVVLVVIGQTIFKQCILCTAAEVYDNVLISITILIYNLNISGDFNLCSLL